METLRIRRSRHLPVLAGALLVLLVQPAAAAPACVGSVEVSGARIERVERSGIIVLDDGRAARLEGLRLPDGPSDHAPKFLGDQALATLTDFAERRTVSLYVNLPKRDRYGRIRSQVIFPDTTDEQWLQIALLRRGLARVFIQPDRPECASDLFAAEADARARRYGIWASTAYAVRTPEALQNDVGTFQVVEGVVREAMVKGGRAYLNFGEDWRTDFTVTIAPDDMKLFKAADIDPESFAGRRVRVRGVVQSFNGPQIELYAPQNLEIVADAGPPSLKPATH
ncbi:MAG: thermonuclease family protein [Alphaproteobacteria bacterium]|nr:thermonuclease family protein [Alphaproteobacteria bacterium]